MYCWLHHWEYWIDNIGTYKNTPCKIPIEYVIEMICDWLGAGIVYSKQRPNYNQPYIEPLEYYNKCKNERIFHEETQELIEFYLNMINNNMFIACLLIFFLFFVLSFHLFLINFTKLAIKEDNINEED